MVNYFIQNPVFLILFLLYAIAVASFIFNLRFVSLTKIRIWGIYLTLDLIVNIGLLMIPTFFHVSFMPYANLLMNVLQIIQFGAILTLFHNHEVAKKIILYTAFGVYFLIWLTEFNAQLPAIQTKGIEAIRYLKIAPVFLRLSTIVGVLIFWTDLFKTREISYLKRPFFWLTLGWFLFFALSCIGYFYDNFDAEASNDSLLKKMHELLNVEFQISEMIAYLCYIIAFWKSKNWVKYIQI